MKYTGDRALIGIPARDLTDEEIDHLATKRGQTSERLRKTLADSGLYAEPKPEPKSSKKDT